MDCMDCILFIKMNKRDWLFHLFIYLFISFIYLIIYVLKSTYPFEPSCVSGFSKSFSTPYNVGLISTVLIVFGL